MADIYFGVGEDEVFVASEGECGSATIGDTTLNITKHLSDGIAVYELKNEIGMMLAGSISNNRITPVDQFTPNAFIRHKD